MAEVLPFKPEFVGEGYRFDADEILEAAKGQEFTCLAILGETEDGELYVAGNANAGEVLVLMEKAKHLVVFGERAG